MKKILKGIWSVVQVIVIVYVIVVTMFIFCENKYGFTQFGKYTFDNVSSMDEKNIVDVSEGDLLIVRRSNDIEIGDVIYYYAAYNETYIVRSDYVKAIDKDDYSSLYTIERNGEEITVSHTRVLGKYANSYSKLGAILEMVESRIGFLFLVLLPIMIVFIYQVYEFVMILRYEDVEDNKKKEKEEPIKTENE